jgi:hypothetical protein
VSGIDVSSRAEEPSKYPYRKTLTIISNLADQRELARIDGALWLPEGSIIELGQPNRDALVIDTRLILGPDDVATILVSVEEGEAGQFVPRHPAERILSEDEPAPE